MRSVISHSEADQFLSCERKHYYAFGYPNEDGSKGLESKRQSDGLFKGNLGHAALEAYYKVLSQFIDKPITDAAIEVAKKAGDDVLTIALHEHPDKMELILGMMQIFNAYVAKYHEEDKQYQYLAVEMEFREDIEDDLTFPFKVDLIRRHRKTGKVEVVDHKFLANLYTADEIAIQPQLPKYIGSLRHLGYEVNGAVYNLVGNRVLKTKPYDAEQNCRRIAFKPTQTRIDRTLTEQYDVVRRIAWFKSVDISAWERAVHRSASSFNCKHCPFLALCVADLNGEDTSVLVKYEFQPNSYGYDKEVPAND